jgi:hypothetical protein
MYDCETCHSTLTNEELCTSTGATRPLTICHLAI